MATTSCSRKRPREEDLHNITQSPSTSVALASVQASPTGSPNIFLPPPVNLNALPTFQSAFAPRLEEGVSEPSSEGDRYFLFRVAKKHGLAWAIKGQASPSTGELGRPPIAHTPDKIRLSPGAAVDLLASVNNHLNVPPSNSVPSGFGAIIASSSRRAQPHVSSGFQPIPMSRYSSEVSELASFLDRTPTAQGTPNFPSPVFPKTVKVLQHNALSSIEGITAVNILNDLPETAAEDRARLHGHIASLFFACLRRASEGLGSELRAVRHTHLAGADQSTREAMVNQPILSDRLYTDVSSLSIPVDEQPGPSRQETYSPHHPSDDVRTYPSPHYSNVTPFQGAHSVPGSPDGDGNRPEGVKTPPPLPLDLSWRNRGDSH